jgi:hypothetical protein
MDYLLVLATLMTSACYIPASKFSWLTSRSSRTTKPKLSDSVCPQPVRQQAVKDVNVACFPSNLKPGKMIQSPVVLPQTRR